MTTPANVSTVGSSLSAEHLCDQGGIVADLSLEVLQGLVEAGGAKLLHARTRWGLHALHFAAGNLTSGPDLLPHLLQLYNLPAHQVILITVQPYKICVQLPM